MDNPWEVTAEALAVMQELATEAGDEKLGKMLRRYEKTPDISNAKKIAGMLCRSSHLPVITLLGEKSGSSIGLSGQRFWQKTE